MMDKAKLDDLGNGSLQQQLTQGEWIDLLSLAYDGLTFRMLNEQGHVVEFTEDGGWGIEHPVTCRIDARLLSCDVHLVVSNLRENPYGEPGRYRVIVGESGVLEGWKLPSPQVPDVS